MDATLVAAQARRPSMADGPGAGSRTDPDATWTRKGGGAHFGYKAHLGVDAGSGLIRRAVLTPAHVNESEVADRLVSGDERAVYADKAYESKARRARLRAQGINDRIMHRSHKHQRGLPYWQQRRNALIGKVRAPVEHVFGTFEAELRVPDGALPGAGAERGGAVVQMPGLQPAACRPLARAGRWLTWDPCAVAAGERRGNARRSLDARPLPQRLAVVWRRSHPLGGACRSYAKVSTGRGRKRGAFLRSLTPNTVGFPKRGRQEDRSRPCVGWWVGRLYSGFPRGVAQPGSAHRSGTMRSEVQILSPRPLTKSLVASAAGDRAVGTDCP